MGQNDESKDLDLPKVVELFQQNTHDRRNKKNTKAQALISNQEKEIEETPIQKNNRQSTILDKVKRETQRPRLQIL